MESKKETFSEPANMSKMKVRGNPKRVSVHAKELGAICSGGNLGSRIEENVSGDNRDMGREMRGQKHTDDSSEKGM